MDYNNSIGAGDVFFKNSEDARTVINNPNFRDILDKIYKDGDIRRIKRKIQ